MQFVNIAGAATLTAVGLASLAGSAVLWSRAGVDLKVVAQCIDALSA